MSTQRRFGDARYRAWWSSSLKQWAVIDRWAAKAYPNTPHVRRVCTNNTISEAIQAFTDEEPITDDVSVWG